jgi:hypothetical protein
MLDASSVLFEDDGLRIVSAAVYTTSPSNFSVLYKVNIYNERTEKIILMSPRLDFHMNLRLLDGECFDRNIEIEQGQSKALSFSIQADQADLASCYPFTFSFFLFSQSEFENTVSRRHSEYDRWKKTVVFPLNLLKFLSFEYGADFGVVETLKLNEELVVSNQRLHLKDLQTLFPNLGRDSLNISYHWVPRFADPYGT